MKLVIALLLLNVIYFAAAQTKYDTPGIYTFTVPTTVKRVGISCIGASGGNNAWLAGNIPEAAGRGASAYGEFYVTGGQQLTVVVGGKGGDAYNGDWDEGAGGGGGASYVYISGWDQPLVVAGGGGGSAAPSAGEINYRGVDASILYNGVAAPSAGGDAPPNIGNSAGGAGGKGWYELKGSPFGKTNPTTNGAGGGYGGGGANKGWAGGGGGGYSGGPAGRGDYVDRTYGMVGGGGGGSWVNMNYASRPMITRQSRYGNGIVTIHTTLSCLNGGFLNVQNSTCVCASGYKGMSCELAPGCQGISPIDNQTSSYPLVSSKPTMTLFTGNALQVTLVGKYVMGRSYKMLTFNGGASIASSCALNGRNSYWTQDFADGWDCEDRLILTLPWKNHTQCGFTRPDENVAKYTATLQLTYTEDTGDHFGLTVLRTVTHAYNLDITFPTDVEAKVSAIKINSVVLFDCVLSGESFDYANNWLVLTFKAISPWSSMISSQVDTIVPAHMNLITAPVVDSSGCGQTPGSNCIQIFSIAVQLKNQSACIYDGKFFLNTTIYSCRENNGIGCNTAKVDMDFTVKSGSVCAAVSVAPTISAVLNIAHTLDWSDPSNLANFNYKLGQQAYFYVNIDAGVGNTVDLRFETIKYVDAYGVEKPLYRAADGSSAEGESSKMLVMDKAKYFSMFFSGAVFKIPFGETWNYTIVAACTVIYSGNKQRSVEAVWSSGTSVSPAANFQLQGVQHIQADVLDNDVIVNKEGPNGISLYSAVGIAAAGVVTGLAAVLVVVVVVFKKLTARLQAEKAATPLLATSL